MPYQKTIEQLREVASVFWPLEFSKEVFEQSVIPLLLDTQERFIAILNVPISDIVQLFAILNASDFPPNLFLKHLLVLTDFGGEMLQRVNEFFDLLFPTGEMVYQWGNEKQERVYSFKALPVRGVLNNALLQLNGVTLQQKAMVSGLVQDVVALLLVGSTCTNPHTAAVLQKCVISRYFDNPVALATYIKQRYIWVSRITGGSEANTLGQLAERAVVDYLAGHLNVPGVVVQRGGHLPGVSHKDRTNAAPRPTTFDVVVSKATRYAAIEVSFQVTTNSTIERKSRDAQRVFTQAEAAGYKIAYVIDGAGNFQRKAAVSTLCQYSHCTVAFSPAEFEVLCQFLREYLEG